MDLFSELNQLMVEYRFRPNRKMAQLFIVNQEVIDALVEAAELSPDDTVLEIGAGTGFLTRALQEKCNVIAVELDDTLFELLKRELPQKNLELVHGNFLEVPLGKFNKVVSLPPYTISSQVMFRLFALKPKLCVLVFQKEFAERLLAQRGFVKYNALSVLSQYYFNIEVLGKVAPSSFFPKPNSDSEIVRLVFRQSHRRALDEKAFELFLKSVFRFQNKNLLNAVKNSLPFLKEQFKEPAEAVKALASHPLGKEKVNLLSCDEFVAIFNESFKAGKQ